MLFHPFQTDAITVRPHSVTMNSDFEQFLYVIHVSESLI